MDESALAIGAFAGIVFSVAGLVATAPPQAPSGVLAPPPVSHRMDHAFNPRSNVELCKELSELHASDPNMGLIEQAARRTRCQVLLPHKQ